MAILLDRPATRRCVRLFDDDYEFLALVARANQISRDAIIRQIISNHVRNLRQRETEALKTLDILSPDLDDELCDLGLGGE
jgi:hypothetical protein